MSAILFDLDGVLYAGDRAIDGAADTVRWFVQNRIPHLFLTNTTSKSRPALVEKLATFGIDSTLENFLTPALAARQWLQQNRLNNIAAFVTESTKSEFSDFNLLPAGEQCIEAVVIGDLGQQWSFELMNTVLRTLLVNPQAKLIALGMTRYWSAATGLQLDVGPMIKAFEYAAGIEAVVTGKPAKAFFQAALNLLGEQHSSTVMIGDDIHGDIEAAQLCGLTAILVRTGKFSENDLALDIKPDAIIDSIAALPQWWMDNR